MGGVVFFFPFPENSWERLLKIILKDYSKCKNTKIKII